MAKGMDKMDKDRKTRIAHEVIVILGAMALLMLVTRLWPVLFLVMLAIIVCALRMLFLRLSADTVEDVAPKTPELQPPDTEASITIKAFSLLQRRITEDLALAYPLAEWVWSTPNAISRFRGGQPLIILLNRAGGYQKAQVLVSGMLFKGLAYADTAAQPSTTVLQGGNAAAQHTVDGEDEDHNDTAQHRGTVNYGRLAFDWVDANTVELSTRYNEAVAQCGLEMLVAAEDLPHPDSWNDICAELRRNGFNVSGFGDAGITVNTTQ